MKRLRITVLLAVALAALVGAGASKAQRAVHLPNAVDETSSFVDPFLSDQCGFPVTVTVIGAFDVTLVYDDAGLVVREVDTTPAGTVTFSSDFGSFSYPLALEEVAAYPGGATLGSTANLTESGLFTRVTGEPETTLAGISIIENAVVVGFTPEGIPITSPSGATTFSFHGTGSKLSVDEFLRETCAALSA
jgi:hypothetical protein